MTTRQRAPARRVLERHRAAACLELRRLDRRVGVLQQERAAA